MIALETFCGLPIRLDGSKLVFFNIRSVKPTARRLKEMQDVLLYEASNPEEFYYMYRGVGFERYEELFKKNNLRYDLTVIPNGLVGKEFMKTYGHNHPLVQDENLSFPEIYEVIYGTAHYLLQKEDDAIVFEAKQGEKVIIPPNYAHITINPGKTPLVMSNVTERNFSSEYFEIKEKKGGMFFETIEGWKRNLNYENGPALRKTGKQTDVFGLGKKSLYTQCIEEINKFDFLKKPQKYLKEFEKLIE